MNIFGPKKGTVVAEEELVSLVSGRREDASSKLQEGSATVQLTLSIKGMHCSACSTAVEAALK